MAIQKDPRRHGVKVPVFYIIYFVCLAVVLFALTAALGTVTDRLAEYEAAQPRHTAEAVFNKYFSPIDYASLLADAEYDADGLSTVELMTYLSGQIGKSTLTFAAGSSSDAETMRYIVRAGTKQVAAIDLVKSAETTKHGYTTYEFSGLELFIVKGDTPTPPTPGIVIKIEAPDGYRVTVDNAAVTSEDLTSTTQKSDALKYYPSGVYGVEYDVYTLADLESLPTSVVVTAANGANAEVTFDEETNTYTAGIVYSDDLKAQHAEFVTNALEGYASYTHRVPGSGFSKIKGYFDQSSQLYSDVEAIGSDLWMEKKPEGDTFENVEVGEFFMLSDGVISCHVSFVQMLHLDGDDRPEALDMYVFLHKVGDEYRIFEWHQV